MIEKTFYIPTCFYNKNLPLLKCAKNPFPVEFSPVFNLILKISDSDMNSPFVSMFVFRNGLMSPLCKSICISSIDSSFVTSVTLTGTPFSKLP